MLIRAENPSIGSSQLDLEGAAVIPTLIQSQARSGALSNPSWGPCVVCVQLAGMTLPHSSQPQEGLCLVFYKIFSVMLHKFYFFLYRSLIQSKI